MSCGHGFDAKQTILPASRNEYIQEIPSDRFSVKRPGYFDGRVALRDGADDRYCFAPVGRLVGNREWLNLRSH